MEENPPASHHASPVVKKEKSENVFRSGEIRLDVVMKTITRTVK